MPYIIVHRTTGGFIGRNVVGDVPWRLTRHREDAHEFHTDEEAEAARTEFDTFANAYDVVEVTKQVETYDRDF